MRSSTVEKATLATLASLLMCLTLFADNAKRSLNPDGKHLFILTGQSNMREPLPKTFRAIVEKTFGK